MTGNTANRRRQRAKKDYLQCSRMFMRAWIHQAHLQLVLYLWETLTTCQIAIVRGDYLPNLPQALDLAMHAEMCRESVVRG